MKKLVSRLALIALAATLFGLAGSSPANAGSYTFQGQCSGGYPSQTYKVWGDSFYPLGGLCNYGGMGFEAGDGWTAPLSLGVKGSFGYDLGAGAKFTYIHSLSHRNVSSANIASGIRIEGGSVNLPVVPTALGTTSTGTVTNLSIPTAAQGPELKASLECVTTSCTMHEFAASWITSPPRLTINDYTPPVVGRDGTLISSTPVSGTRTVEPVAVDGNSGIRLIWGIANDQVVFLKPAACNSITGVVDKLRPCPNPYAPGVVNIDTTASPWVEGANSFKVCGMNFAGDSTCTDPWTAQVDN